MTVDIDRLRAWWWIARHPLTSIAIRRWALEQPDEADSDRADDGPGGRA